MFKKFGATWRKKSWLNACSNLSAWILLEEGFDDVPNDFGRVEVDVVRPVNLGVDELGVALLVDVQDRHRHLLLFVQAAAVGFDDQMGALDVRRVLLDGVGRVAVKTSGSLTQVPGEGVEGVGV